MLRKVVYLFCVCFTLRNYAVEIGTPFTKRATKVVLCGAGELGKELAIELQRLGVEVIAIDRYANAPAMQIAHRSHVVDIRDKDTLYAVIKAENPTLIVPELESIATDALLQLEQEGYRVIPTASAAHITMNREKIRKLAAEELGLKTSPYRFVESQEAFYAAIAELGLPCVIKPIISSSGKGQSVVRSWDQVDAAWEYAQKGGRGAVGKAIVEGFIDFEYEITLLTIRHSGQTTFCAPIGHLQIDGDYRESWQPHPMHPEAKQEAERIARIVTERLGGSGIFGVEFLIKDDAVYFSEISPRPHDTGMVTLISQNLSEFALHARAILGLPIPKILSYGPSASCAFIVKGSSSTITYCNLKDALEEPDTELRLFGKPIVQGHRRMGVALARAESVNEALLKARRVIEKIEVRLD